MSESNGHNSSSNTTIPSTTVHEVPGQTRFVAHGQPFTLDLLETNFVLQDIATEIAAANGSHRQYLQRVIDHVQSLTGVTLTFGEADWLNDEIDILYAQAKKKRRETFAAALPLRSSTASTPAD